MCDGMEEDTNMDDRSSINLPGSTTGCAVMPVEFLPDITKVESKAKTRDLIQFSILSIEVSSLPSAHRFTKNCPWLKGTYGENYSWVAEYSKGSVGDAACWSNLGWNFNLERNNDERNDLVVTVCSKLLIIGRYVLKRSEFCNIPDTKSGYFEVSGQVVNQNGNAGEIKILCLKGSAPRPPAVLKYPKMGSSTKPVERANIIVNALRLRVISVAVVDLTPVHILEANSPHMTMESGSWVGITDVVRFAGIAARWNGLNWIVTVQRENGVTCTVRSNSCLIGKVFIAFDDLVTADGGESTSGDVIKYLTNGKEVSGKLKINFEVIRDDNQVSNFNDLSSISSLHPCAERNFEFDKSPKINLPFTVSIDDLTVLDVKKVHMWSLNSLVVNVACGTYGYVSEEVLNAGQFAQWINLQWTIVVTDKTSVFRVNVWSRGKTIGFSSLSIDQLMEMPVDLSGNTEVFTKIYNGKSELVGKVKITCRLENCCQRLLPLQSPLVPLRDAISKTFEPEDLSYPLLAIVKQISLFDLPSSSSFTREMLKVKVTCDRKSASTDFNNTQGKWENLNWAMMMREDSVIEILVLSSSRVVIGSVQIYPNSLRSVPLNRNGLTEIKLQLNKSGINTGKVQVYFKLEVGASVTDVLSTDDTYSNRNGFNLIESNFDKPISRALVFDTSLLMNQSIPHDSRQNLHFKIIILEIDVSDLANVHTFVQNSVSVSAACGKWTAHTEAIERVSIGFWTNLNWTFDIRDTANLRLVLSSRGIAVGAASISFYDLYSTPSELTGIKRITCHLLNDLKFAGKLKLTFSMEVTQKIKDCGPVIQTDGQEDDICDSTVQSVLDSPCEIEIHGIKATELNSAHLVHQNKPRIKIMCSSFYEETNEKVSSNGAEVYVWKDLGWVCPVQVSDDLRVFVDSGGVLIGQGTINLQTIMLTPKDWRGFRECVVNLSRGDCLSSGKIKLNLKVTAMLGAASSQKQRVESDGVFWTPTRGVINITPNQQCDGLSVVKVLIFAISAIDLIPVHSFISNSPCINIACGKFIAATKELEKAGREASWDTLNFAFLFEKSSSLRILVSSKKVIIGSCSVSREKIVEGKKGEQGYRTVFVELTNGETAPAGKLKIQYFLDL